MAASDTALLRQMDDYILDGKYHEATDAYCRLVAADPDDARRAVTTHVMTTAAPYLHVPAHHKLLPNGEFRNVNYDHTILGIRAGMRLHALAVGARAVPDPRPGHLVRAPGPRRVGAAGVRLPGPLRARAGEVRGGAAAEQQAAPPPLRGPGAAGRGLGRRALPAHVPGHRGRRQGDDLPALPRAGRPARAARPRAQRGPVRRHHRPAGVQLVPQGPPHRPQGHPHALDARHRRLGGLGARRTRTSTSACRTSATRRSSTRSTTTRASCSASPSRARSTGCTRRTSRR